MATSVILPLRDDASDEDTLSTARELHRRQVSARALEILDNAEADPAVANMTDDEVMALACAEIRAYRSEKAHKV